MLTYIFIGISQFLIYDDENWLDCHNMLLALKRVDASPRVDPQPFVSAAALRVHSHSRHNALLFSYWQRAPGERAWVDLRKGAGLAGSLHERRNRGIRVSVQLKKITLAYNRLQRLLKRYVAARRTLPEADWVACGQRLR
jgi:hypothetical protein